MVSSPAKALEGNGPGVLGAERVLGRPEQWQERGCATRLQVWKGSCFPGPALPSWVLISETEAHFLWVASRGQEKVHRASWCWKRTSWVTEHRGWLGRPFSHAPGMRMTVRWGCALSYRNCQQLSQAKGSLAEGGGQGPDSSRWAPATCACTRSTCRPVVHTGEKAHTRAEHLCMREGGQGRKGG